MGEAIPFRRPEQTDEILTRVEVADHFKVHVKTVDRWVKDGCPSETWGMRVRRFRSGEVDRWLRNRRAA